MWKHQQRIVMMNSSFFDLVIYESEKNLKYRVDTKLEDSTRESKLSDTESLWDSFFLAGLRHVHVHVVSV